MADVERLLREHPDLVKPVPKDEVPGTAIAPPSTLFPTVSIFARSRTRTYADRFESDIGRHRWEWRPELGLYWERHPTWGTALDINAAASAWMLGNVASALARAFPGETAVQP
jgi:hypothetical protein